LNGAAFGATIRPRSNASRQGLAMQTKNSLARRTFLKGAAALTAGALALDETHAQQAVPNSAGSERPKLAAPANACDCHMHIYDGERFAPPRPESRMQADARVSDYRLLQKRIGTRRTVVVSPAAYGTDNRVTLDAIAQHVQIHMRADQITAAESLWGRLPCPIVFDHLGRLPQPAGIDDPAFKVMRGLIDKGRTWVKISGAYLNTKIGPPTYADATKVAQAFVQAAPERMVWGSDWPHPNASRTTKPDDAVLFDLLTEWAPDEQVRHRILVDNPQALYGFEKAN
jgi:D-galactarolactone isomerase